MTVAAAVLLAWIDPVTMLCYSEEGAVPLRASEKVAEGPNATVGENDIAACPWKRRVYNKAVVVHWLQC